MRTRRVLQGWSQAEAAKRAGIGVATWQRMEAGGGGHIENLINAAMALRCEEAVDALFPAPAASNMDELLARQAAGASKLPLRIRKHKA